MVDPTTDELRKAVAEVFGLTLYPDSSPQLYVNGFGRVQHEWTGDIHLNFNALMPAVNALTMKHGEHHSFSLMTHDSTGAEPGFWWAAFWRGSPGPGRIMHEAYDDDAALALAKCIYTVMKDE